MASDPALGIARINQRIIVDRAKWYYGYPIAKLKWIDG
jgi:Lrp/AsnC family leucine-responsive transcriptional regulator